MSDFDVIVVGLGAMGSATAYHLAGNNRQVLGLEAFGPAHDRGSSHGESRIIRQAYFENPAYVPLVLRAYELWDRLQRESGKDLLTISGGLAIGPAHGDLVSGCLRSAREYDLPHELLDSGQMRSRFPQFFLAPEEIAFYEERAGFLRPEECIRQHLRGASDRGATLHFEEPIMSWSASNQGEGVTVQTHKQTYRARSLVLSMGSWFAGMGFADPGFADLALAVSIPVVVTRHVMFWFRPLGQVQTFDKGVFPIFLWGPEEGPFLYGFPRLSGETDPKVAIHSGMDTCSPSSIDRVIHPGDEEAIRSAIRDRIPALNGEVSHASTCMYTMTPDEHFIIDRHPDYPQVVLAAGFSGHGFKFSCVVGEILCDLATTRKTHFDISLFSAARFSQSR
jgi:sarcosine oxidase